jgi:CBS domain-containing protein
MSLLNFARTDIVTISPEASVLEAANLMAAKKVGCLVVVENGKPMGILTDRDIVLRVVQPECDPIQTATRDVMTKNPITLGEELGLFEAGSRSRRSAHGIFHHR